MLSPPEICWNASDWKVWPLLKPCVAADRRINETELMLAGSGVFTAKLLPYPTSDGAELIVGRGPRNRYGGE